MNRSWRTPNSTPNMDVARSFNIFEQEEGAGRILARSTFDLSHDVQTTYQMGELVPICKPLECYPNDSFTISSETKLRFAPLVLPIMHRVNVQTFYFFVANRILWPDRVDGWEDFITGDNPNLLPPTVNWSSNLTGSDPQGRIGVYQGLPNHGTNMSSNYAVNAFPIAGYYKIWDEFFRNQQVQTEVFQELTGGVNAYYLNLIDAAPKRVNWNADYFTSALPEPQAGDALLIPVVRDDLSDLAWADSTGLSYPSQWKTNNNVLSPVDNLVFGVGSGGHRVTEDATLGNALGLDIKETAGTISELRKAMRQQEFMELLNRTSHRYDSVTEGFFQVNPMEGVIQDPEFFGMSSGKVIISDVFSSAEVLDNTNAVSSVVGQYAGVAQAINQSPVFQYRCQEWGFIHILQCVTPRSSYTNGMPKMYIGRQTYLDYMWPHFAEIGDQAIERGEVFWEGDEADNRDTWGYTGRYNELRYEQDLYSGSMKDEFVDFHLGRVLDQTHSLNEEFLRCTPRTSDVFITPTGSDHEVYAHIEHKIMVERMLPKFGIPLG